MYTPIMLTGNLCRRINTYLNKIYQQCGKPGKVFAFYLLTIVALLELFASLGVHHFSMESWPQHLACVALALALLSQQRWPENLQQYYPLFFYLCVFYILPLANFLNMLNQATLYEGVTNLMLVIFIVLLVTDLSLFVWMMLAALTLALGLHHLSHLSLSVSICSCSKAFNALLWTVFTGIFFSRYLSRNRVLKKLHEHTEAVHTGGYIAHELRTPLSTIRLYMQSIERCLPELVRGYQCAQQQQPVHFQLSQQKMNGVQQALQDIRLETESAFNVIDMLLVKMNQQTQLKPTQYHTCSVLKTIDVALQRYPFQLGERELVHWDADANFDFHYTGKQDLSVHVIFNLLRNALHHINAAGNGEVYFYLSSDEKYNIISVRDTGPGIAKAHLKKLFSHHFSVSDQGIGLGLSFCQTVMKSYKGKITCDSILGEYTQFNCYFPKWN